jgi:chorismate dehydratase
LKERTSLPYWRIGTVPYLNACPLVYGLERDEQVELISAPPSQLLRLLKGGQIDCGLISSIEAFRHPEFERLPGLGISARGPVQSILLFAKREWSEVQSVALDASSRTSSVLCRLLFHQTRANPPEFISFPPHLAEMLRRCDAGLLIGDPALQERGNSWLVYDLGELWYERTGLPFVYAVWIGPRGEWDSGLAEKLYQSAEEGLTHLEEIAERESQRRGIRFEVCRDYLYNVMHYRLGLEEEKGLSLFVQLAQEYGFLQEENL